MERKIWFLSVLFLLLLIAVGIRFMPERAPSREAGSPPAPATQVLHFGYNINTDSAMHAAAVRFAEQVKRASGDRIEIRLHPNQELGNDHQMLEMARRGELDMLLTPTAKLSVAVPEMQYADLPFFFSSREELYRMLDGPPGNALLKKLSRIGLVGVSFWENGFKHFTANRPLRTPDDFAGLRMRIMKSRMLAEQFKALGAIPIPIDFHATRQALADGAVDGQENPLVAIHGMGFHQVQSHLTLSAHGYLGYVFSISQKTFERLSPEDRALLIDTAREISGWEREETQRREEGFLAEIRAAGVEIHQLDADERALFQQRLAHIPDQFEAVIGPDLLAKTRELRWQALPQKEREKEWIIGVDVDLSSASAKAGMAIRRGVALAVEEINAAGGLLGKPVRLIALDHQGVPSKAVHNLEQFAAMPSLLAVIGGKEGFVVEAELETIHAHKIPFLIPWAAATDLVENGHTPNFVFRCSLNDATAMPFLLDHASAGERPVGLLLERSIWGRSNERAAHQWQQQGSGSLVDIQWFNRGEENFSAQLTDLQRKGAGALVIVANTMESTQIISTLAKHATPLPVYAHWGLTGGEFWEQSRPLLDQVELYFPQTLTLSPTTPPRVAPLLTKYREEFGLAPDTPLPAPLGTIHAYELVGMRAQAVREAGSARHAEVQQALENMPHYRGIIRNYDRPFTADKHDALDADELTMARFDREGHIVPLTP